MMNLRNNALFVDCIQNFIYREILGCRAHTSVYVSVERNRGINVVNQALTYFVDKFQDCNLDTVEFALAHNGAQRLVYKRLILFEEREIKHFREQVPTHAPKSCVSRLCKTGEPSTRLKVI